MSNFLTFSSLDLVLCCYIMFSLLFTVLLSSQKLFCYPSLLNSSIKVTLFTLLLVLVMPNGLAYSISLTAFSGSLYVDSAVLTFKAFTLIASMAVLFISQGYHFKGSSYEIDNLLCCSVYALLVLLSANDFLILYLAIELQSLVFYSLVSINSTREASIEAGIKYFIVGALSSCVLLFGITLVYAGSGSLSFDSLVILARSGTITLDVLGLIFIISSILFKLGMVPFHMWLIDVYEGSRTTLTLFFSTVPKLALTFLILKLCYLTMPFLSSYWALLLWATGLTSVIFASIAAIYQRRIKRLLSYSAIAHIGFIIVALSANDILSTKASMIYIIIYTVMTLFSFGIIISSTNYKFYPKYLVD